MPFHIVIEPRALADIQQGIDYYEEQLAGLGKRFSETVDLYITVLSNNPYYQIRYKDYRVLPTGLALLKLREGDASSLTLSCIILIRKRCTSWLCSTPLKIRRNCLSDHAIAGSTIRPSGGRVVGRCCTNAYSEQAEF